MVFRPVYSGEIPPKASYLSTCSGLEGVEPVPIVLADWGIEPGDWLLINGEGMFIDYVFTYQHLSSYFVGVFSSSDEITKEVVVYPPPPGGSGCCGSSGVVYRNIPGAIDAGDDYATDAIPFCDGRIRDIPEDFEFHPHTGVIVPQGATHLPLATAVSASPGSQHGYWSDNRRYDPDPGRATITSFYVPAWEPFMSRASRVR